MIAFDDEFAEVGLVSPTTTFFVATFQCDFSMRPVRPEVHIRLA